MAARILDGKALAAEIRAGVKAKVAALATPPGLAVILAGEDPASRVYVRNKVRACEETGVRSSLFQYGADVGEAELLEIVKPPRGPQRIGTGLLAGPPPPLPDRAARRVR